MAVQRARFRVTQGGHAVPEEIVRRRYEEGFRNLFQKYRQLVDIWQIFDNSIRPAQSIARGAQAAVRIDDLPKWSKLEAEYGHEQ